MAATDQPPLILFSGLAADANVFVPQRIAFPQLIVPDWPVPASQEPMGTYCERIADKLRSHGPCVIGGASFGGLIAQEVSRHITPRAILLIGSVRSPADLPRYVRCSRRLRFLVPLIPVRLLQFILAPAASSLARRIMPHLCGLACQFRGSDPTVFKWSLIRMLEWNSTPVVNCPVFQIHGDRDFVLPSRLTHPDHLVHGGGHVISLTHPKEVNNYIRNVLDQLSDMPGIAPDEELPLSQADT